MTKKEVLKIAVAIRRILSYASLSLPDIREWKEILEILRDEVKRIDKKESRRKKKGGD